jgi:ABC-type glycerol-3-phosphate transport system substrate-binding protein
MKSLRIILSIIGLLALTACGGGSSSTASNNDTVTGVATAAQVSVVTAK